MKRLEKWIRYYKHEIKKHALMTRAVVVVAYDALRRPAGTEFTIRGKKCNRFQYLYVVIPKLLGKTKI